MKRKRLAWTMLVIAALLLTGCARGLSREEAAQPVDPVQQAIAEANLAAEAVKAASAKGDMAAMRAAYKRFSEAFGQVLAPVGFEDPLLAQKMANANSTIQEMLKTGKVDPAAVAKQVATIRQGLGESTTVMTRVKSQPGSATREGQAAPAAGKSGAVTTAGKAGEQRAGVGGVTLTVTAGNYKLQPGEIRVKKGARVTVRFENKGTERHEFEIEDLDFEIGPIEPGQVVEKSFIASRAGLFAYECHVDDHLRKGMKGVLIVE